MHMNMRKRGILLLLSMLMCCTGCTSGISDSEQKTDEKGSVVSDNGKQDDTEEPDDGLVTVWLPEKVFEVKEDGEEKISELWKYDTNGNLLEHTKGSYRSEEKNIFLYDEAGNKIKKSYYEYEDDKETYREIFTYNEKGDVTEETFYFASLEDSNEQIRKYEYVYDEKGRMTESIEKLLGSTQIHKKNYSYDNNNRLIRELSYYYREGETEPYSYYDTSYKYDEDGNILLFERLEDGKFFKNETYEYDNNGKLLVKTELDEDGRNVVRNYKYDSNGNMLSEVHASDEKQLKAYTYEYDSNGNLIREEGGVYNEEKSIYEYVYDESGKLIKTVKVYRNKESVLNHYYDEYGNLIKEMYDDSTSYKAYTYIKVRVTPEQKEKIEKQLEEVK